MLKDASKTYTINEIANAHDITARTLRHYEELGLISPERQGQKRIYHQDDKARLAWVLRGRRVGFSLTEIGEMLNLYSLSDSRETQRAVTADRCRERIDQLKAQRDDINASIEDLEGFHSLISNLVRSDDGTEWIHKDTGKPLKGYTPE